MAYFALADGQSAVENLPEYVCDKQACMQERHLLALSAGMSSSAIRQKSYASETPFHLARMKYAADYSAKLRRNQRYLAFQQFLRRLGWSNLASLCA